VADVADAVVLDVDGTLVDSNYQHALAWFRAFRRHGITLPLWRIHRTIGMGGDQLVGAVGGEEVERRYGEGIRAAWAEEYRPMLAEVRPLDGFQTLLEAVAASGMRLVLASSGKPEHVEAYLDMLDGRRFAEAWTSSQDVEHTKPSPDLVSTALGKVSAQRAVVIGDSVWDCAAAARLDVPAVAVLTGGFSEQELRDAGARHVYTGLDELAADVHALPLARPAARGCG
jgi:HAD superfamily hydrolase (TIGR01549 family)